MAARIWNFVNQAGDTLVEVLSVRRARTFPVTRMSQALTGIVMETYLQQEVMKVMPGSGQQLEIKPLVQFYVKNLSVGHREPELIFTEN